MSSLIERRCRQYITSGHSVSIRLATGETLLGSPLDIDEQQLCLRDPEGHERIIRLADIQSLGAFSSIQMTLQAALQSRQPVRVVLKDGSLASGPIDELDNQTVVLKDGSQEHVVQITGIARVENSELSRAEVAPRSPVPSASDPMMPIRVAPPSTTQGIDEQAFPLVFSAAEALRFQLSHLAWPKSEVCDIERKCPVSTRVDSRAERIWGRALNYHHDRAWQKAGEEFRAFVESYRSYVEGYYNAGVCFYLAGDIDQSLACYDRALMRKETKECFLNSILAAVRKGVWRLAIDWMKKYLAFSAGGDADAFRVIDFQLRFGLHSDAIATMLNACGFEFPIPTPVALRYLSYLATKVPAPSERLLAEIEQGLASQQYSTEQLQRLLGAVERIATNKQTADFVMAQDVENQWRGNQEERIKQDELYGLRRELDEAWNLNKLKDAEALCEAVLRLDSNDAIARTRLEHLRKPKVPVTRTTQPAPTFPPVPRDNRFYRGHKLMISNRLPEAEKVFLECIATNENVENSVKNLASIYLRTERFQEGVSILNEYLGSATEKESFYNILGQLYFKAGEYERAISAYQAVCDLQSVRGKRINPLMNIAATHVRRGDVAKAETVLREVLLVNPNHAQAKNILTRLQSAGASDTVSAAQMPEQTDIESYIALLSRPVGVGTTTVGISKFMRFEVEECNITALDRYRIEKKEFTLKDVQYLFDKGGGVAVTKPEQRAQYFISAARVLSELNEEQSDRFSQALRGFCAAIGDHYVIVNRDVARAYYVEAFKLEPRVTPQLESKLGQLIMSFQYDNDAFLRPRQPPTSQLLSNAISPDRPEERIKDVVRAVIGVTRVNPDVISTLLKYMKEEPPLRERLCSALVMCFGEVEGADANSQIIALITRGQEIIGREQEKFEGSFSRFLENSNTYQALYNVRQEFLEFSPDFRSIGVDFNDTDKRRMETLHAIMRQYVEYYDEQVFDKKDATQSYLLNQIQYIARDIKEFPTYYSRVYLLPLLRAWDKTISTHFGEVARVSQPSLRVAQVLRCSQDDSRVEAHLLVSNREGKSAASGVKVWILPSRNGEYEREREYYEAGRTIPAGSDTTVPVRLLLTNAQPVLTLNYRLSYTRREGTESPSEDWTIPLRMGEEIFEPIDPNPYAAWANASAVTEERMFKGRWLLVEALRKAIQEEKQKKMIVIYGQKRAGKSSILHWVDQRLHFPAVPVYLSLGKFALNLSVDNVFYGLARALHEALSRLDSVLAGAEPVRAPFQNDAFGEFVEYVERLLMAFRQDARFAEILPVLILDEFTYIHAGIQQGGIHPNFMKAWKSLVEKRYFSFLLSGIDEMPEFISTYPNEFGVADLRPVGYLDDKGARELIEEPIWNHQKNSSRFQESALRRVMELTANSAYYIQILNRDLVVYMNEQRTGYVTEADVNRVLAQLIEPGRGHLNLASNFDNLTRYKTGISQSEEVESEGRLLRIIAFLTKNQDFASREAILSLFPLELHDLAAVLIQRLVDRDVLVVRAGHQQYAIRVELFKHWLNANLPYRENAV